MIDFDQEFYDSNKIVLETLDDIDEYITTVDVWLSLHDTSEKDVLGSESFGFYALHLFDAPVDIITPDGEVLDSFLAAVVYDSPGKLEDRETSSFTFSTHAEAQDFFDTIKDEFYEKSMEEEESKEEYSDVERGINDFYDRL